ncbi:MAG: prephenate dehydrogenase/arogenate dehydrogenase family protein [Candidatus Nealsonbacteria bacterium CG08_land_8_20_14_0_20_43_11]|uniref:Prephenate dehydrogenase/arogenate dehydrogenase family protein n=1 Tax=Candidatus Nealsonbacteria bacterium CG08_land_8_20_14_0_20_43_11 TaxID=1974706 RepID=A0A2M6T0T9_9BACT|nr:MAG: prephenate dehydrogenase/arogenate dehydrogenase family protein [Candidatus Nealsonbacteria bacterium CG08_land_8_20_14_0_20_43_11]
MRVGIIGFGRFGQLLAQMLKKEHRVIVFDNNLVLKNKAKNLGVAFNNLETVCRQDLVILAAPISQIEKLLLQIKNKLLNNVIVMDTCSVKEYPAVLMQKILPQKIQILATHPMFGPDSAKHGLMGLKMVFCPLRVSAKNYQLVKRTFQKLGLKIIQTTPEEHDRQNALSLALVHFVGRGLEKMKIKPQTLTTLGFERLLKVCETVTNDTWQLFEDMQNYNRFAKPLRKKFIRAMATIDKKLK